MRFEPASRPLAAQALYPTARIRGPFGNAAVYCALSKSSTRPSEVNPIVFQSPGAAPGNRTPRLILTKDACNLLHLSSDASVLA